MRLVVLGVFEQDFVHVGRGVLVQFVAAAEDDEGDLAVAQHRQLVGLLHQPEFPLGECYLQVSSIMLPVTTFHIQSLTLTVSPLDGFNAHQLLLNHYLNLYITAPIPIFNHFTILLKCYLTHTSLACSNTT